MIGTHLVYVSVIAVLGLAVWHQSSRNEALTGQQGKQSERIEQLLAEREQGQAALKARNDAFNRLSQSLATYQELAQQAKDAREKIQNQRNEAIRNDEDSSHWRDRPLPGVIRRLYRAPAADGTGSDTLPKPDSTGVSDPAPQS